MISFRPPNDLVADPSSVVDREWIVTYGIGGYASGTIAGVFTRRYHGLPIAALDPPLDRTVLSRRLPGHGVSRKSCGCCGVDPARYHPTELREL